MSSPPDDIMRRLKQLIDRRNEAEGQASQEANSESETSSQMESPRLGASQTLSLSQNSNSSLMDITQK